jgi:hypothetical protein
MRLRQPTNEIAGALPNARAHAVDTAGPAHLLSRSGGVLAYAFNGIRKARAGVAGRMLSVDDLAHAFNGIRKSRARRGTPGFRRRPDACLETESASAGRSAPVALAAAESPPIKLLGGSARAPAPGQPNRLCRRTWSVLDTLARPASDDEEGCAARLRAAPFVGRAVCARAKSLAAIPFGCKHEAESDDLEPKPTSLLVAQDDDVARHRRESAPARRSRQADREPASPWFHAEPDACGADVPIARPRTTARSSTTNPITAATSLRRLLRIAGARASASSRNEAWPSAFGYAPRQRQKPHREASHDLARLYQALVCLVVPVLE